MRIVLPLSLLVASLALLIPACGGGAADDPRCVSLCTIKEPSNPKIGAVCNQESADACRETCGTHIQDTATVCADCLLEGAYFGTGNSGSGGGDECQTSPMCPNGSLCTMSNNGVSCDYCSDNAADKATCEEKTNPRREVACDVDFRDVTECAALCVAK